MAYTDIEKRKRTTRERVARWRKMQDGRGERLEKRVEKTGDGVTFKELGLPLSVGMGIKRTIQVREKLKLPDISRQLWLKAMERHWIKFDA